MNKEVLTDKSGMVRPGEELDNAKLHAYLLSHLENTGDNPELLVEQFPHGYSNLTYRVQFGNKDMVLRRPPFGANIKSGHDMEREYKVLFSLASIYDKVPRPVIYCDDLSIIGASFYLMERVTGVILRDTPPPGLNITPSVMSSLSKAVIQNLASIHSLDYLSTDLKNLARPGDYVERQISGWVQRYAMAKTDELPEVERVANWLIEHKPTESASCLIHNDYKYDNIVLNPDNLPEIIAVLDWEMATIGDPLMDLGTSLAYWIDPNDPPELQTIQKRATLWPGNLDRAQLVQFYTEQSKRDVGNIVFYYVYGLFKIAVIVQQIYARYRKGLTADPRFAKLDLHLKAQIVTATRAIELNRIDQLG